MTQYTDTPDVARHVPVWHGTVLGEFYVAGARGTSYHQIAGCSALTSPRAYRVTMFDHDGIHRRPFMREQDTLDEATRPMVDEGKKLKPCSVCVGKAPQIIHLETEKPIPCEGSDEWMQMEGAKAARDPEIFRPEQVSCFRCPIRVECFGKAMREAPEYGIWGGTTPAQRKAWGDRADEIVIRRLRNGQEVKPYGGPGKKPAAYTPTLEGVGSG